MTRMTQAVLKAGLITPNMLREIKRFSPTIDCDAEVEEPKELEYAAKIIADALESQEYTLIRETDLDILRQYAEEHRAGTLHLETLNETAEFTITYCVSKTGEYIIAWTDEGSAEDLANGVTYLRTSSCDVFFKDVRELWYGEKKAFAVCIPSGVNGGHRG
jgi:hypothetical protein